MGLPANYEILIDNSRLMILQDRGPWDKHFTITNDAERVVAQLTRRLKGRRLFYFDSEGDLDELLVRDGKFAGFGCQAAAFANGAARAAQ